MVDRQRGAALEAKECEIGRLRQLLDGVRIGEVTATKFLRRPEATWDCLAQQLPQLRDADDATANQVTFDIKYAGYIERQNVEIERQRRLAEKRIPRELDYTSIKQLRTEAREKLSRIRPNSLAQASRISGITPADVALLMTHLHANSPSDP